MPACDWLERDSEGRPRCVHGWAHKAGRSYRCREKNMSANRKYNRTEQGRESQRRQNAKPHTKSSKALHELTRIRVS